MGVIQSGVVWEESVAERGEREGIEGLDAGGWGWSHFVSLVWQKLVNSFSPITVYRLTRVTTSTLLNTAPVLEGK